MRALGIGACVCGSGSGRQGRRGTVVGKSLENLRLDTLSRSTRVEDQRFDVIRLNSQNKVFREMLSTLSTHPGTPLSLKHQSLNESPINYKNRS